MCRVNPLHWGLASTNNATYTYNPFVLMQGIEVKELDEFCRYVLLNSSHVYRPILEHYLFYIS